MKIDYILYGNDDGICVETYNYKREERLSHMTNYMFGLFILLTNDIYGIIELIGDISKKHINSDGTFNNNPIFKLYKKLAFNKVYNYFSENYDDIYDISGFDFEILMLEAYRRKKYNVEHTKMTRDGGKDIIIKQNDIWGKTISYVQCKNRRGKIGVSCVKEFHSTIVNDKINRGIIVSTSGFTHDAEKYIEKYGLENIVILHNGKDVRELFKMVSNLT